MMLRERGGARHLKGEHGQPSQGGAGGGHPHAGAPGRSVVALDGDEERGQGGIGFDGVVSVEARNMKWLPGPLVYLVAVLKTLIFHHQAPELAIRFDERS